MSVTDYPDFQTPQANATAISTTGAPLLNLHNAIINESGSLGPGTRQVLATADFNQPGWTAWISLEYTGAATEPFPQLVFQWQDSASGVNVSSDIWYLAGGDLTSNIFTGNGHCPGDQLVLELANPDTAQTLVYDIAIFQSSQVFTRQDIRLDWSSPAYSVPGQTLPDYSDPAALLLGQRANGALAAGTSDGAKILPPFGGRVWVYANSASNTTDLTVVITVPAEPSMTSETIAILHSDSGGSIYQYVNLPRAACAVNMTNHNAAAKACQWAVIAAEY